MQAMQYGHPGVQTGQPSIPTGFNAASFASALGNATGQPMGGDNRPKSSAFDLLGVHDLFHQVEIPLGSWGLAASLQTLPLLALCISLERRNQFRRGMEMRNHCARGSKF